MFGFISRHLLLSGPPCRRITGGRAASATHHSHPRNPHRRLAFEAMEERLVLSHGAAFCADHPDHPHCGGGEDPPPPPEPVLAYTVVDLGTLGGTESYAADLNDAGQVVGNSRTASGDTHAFLWQDLNGNGQSDAGEMIDLGTLSGSRSWASGINNLGQVVGQSRTTGGLQAFLVNPEDTDGDSTPDTWFRDDNSDGINDLMIDLGSLGGVQTIPHAINDSGQVVGRADTSDSSTARAFLINPEDTDGDGAPDRWFRDVDGDGINDLMTDLGTLGGPRSSAFGINSAGQVVGTAESSETEPGRAFLINPEDTDGDGELDWFVDTDEDGANDLMIDLATLSGQLSTAGAINENGQILGSSAGPVIWEVDVVGNVTVTELGVPKGFERASASDINDAAQVVGSAGKNSGAFFSACKKHNNEPYLWQNGQVIRFEDLVSDMGGFNDLDVLTGINNSGQIIGVELLTNSICDPIHAFIALPSATSSSSTASGSLLAFAFENSTGDTSSSDGGSGDMSPLFVEETTAVDYAPPTGNRRTRARAVDNVMTSLGGESGSAADTRLKFDGIGNDLLEDLVVAQL